MSSNSFQNNLFVRARRNRSRTTRQIASFAPSGVNYRPDTMGLTPGEISWLKGYLNGAHNNNYQSMAGAPTGPGNPTVIRHFLCESNVIPDSTGKISLAVTGCLEAPLLYYLPQEDQIRVFEYSSAKTQASPGGYYDWDDDYMRANGVEAYRCVSLSVKIEDATPEIYKGGTIRAVTHPGDFDLKEYCPPTKIVAPTYLETNTNLTRIFETMPGSPEDLTSINTNIMTGLAADGGYVPIPAMDMNFPFFYRNSRAVKAVSAIGYDIKDINAAGYSPMPVVLGVKTPLGGDLLPQHTGTGTVDMTNNQVYCCSQPCMQAKCILGSGLDPAHCSWNVSVRSTWEFIPGWHSPLADLSREAMPANQALLAAAARTFRVMPPMYPASANGWNEIWKTFKDVYSSYVSPIAEKIIPILPPQYSGAAGSAKGLLDLVTDAKKEIKDEVKDQVRQVLQPAASLPITKPRVRGRRPN